MTKCPKCSSKDIIKVYTHDKVKFECVNGHTWFEHYSDNGGALKRSKSYEVKLKDMLFAREKIIYQKIMNELESNKQYYIDASPLHKTKTLIKNCNISENDLYEVMKKVVNYYK